MSIESAVPPRLPDELILAIFQNRSLFPYDLRNCSLICRNLLESANKELYRVVEVDLVTIRQKNISEAEEDVVRKIEYSKSSWKLVRTLMDHPKLAGYVRTLQIVYRWPSEYPSDGPSGFETNFTYTLSTTLRLARYVKRVRLNCAWTEVDEDSRAVMKQRDIDMLSLNSLDEDQLSSLADSAPTLRYLEVTSLYLSFGAAPLSAAIYPQHLSFLDIFAGDTSVQIPLVLANATTLRTLLISLNVALELDYTTFPVLKQLHLGHLSPSNSTASSSANSRCTQFWTSLRGSPSLHALSFGFDLYGDGFEQALFAHPIYEQSSPREPVATLRRIEFPINVRLDRANYLLSGPLASTIHQVVIPSRLSSPDADLLSANKYNSIVGMCEARSIELILTDHVEFAELCKPRL